MEKKSIRVLHIEDNLADHKLVIEYLKDYPFADFEITHAESLGKAKEFLDVDKYDIILADLGLTDAKSDFVVASLLAYLSTSVVIILTGSADDQRLFQYFELGIDEILVKGAFKPDAFPRRLLITYLRAQRRIKQPECLRLLRAKLRVK